MDSNQRPRLNFATGGTQFTADRSYQATNDRIYPTTPSTFPHPVLGQQQGGQATDYLGNQIQSPSAAYPNPNGAGYFGNTQYTAHYGQSQQQNPYANQYQQQSTLQSPQQGTFSPRQANFNPNDPTAGLTRQFSNQNLGTGQRGAPQYRQPSSQQQQRPAGLSSQGSYNSHLAPAISTQGAPGQSPVHLPPPKSSDRFSPNVSKRGQGLHVFVEAFFRDSIDRARERNARYVCTWLHHNALKQLPSITRIIGTALVHSTLRMCPYLKYTD